MLTTMNCTRGNGAGGSGSIMRFLSGIATFGVYRPASSGTSTRGSITHDPCALGRSAPLLSTLCSVRALPHPAAAQSTQAGRVERRDGLACDRRPRLLHHSAAVHGTYRGAPDERLRAASHGKRATRAGPFSVSEAPNAEALAALLRRPALA